MSSNKTLEDVELHQEDDEYYLTLTYNEKLGDNEYEIKIPKINLDFLKYDFGFSIVKSEFGVSHRFIEYDYPYDTTITLPINKKENPFYIRIPKKKKMRGIDMKSMYAESKYLVINEEIFIYIYGDKLRYIDNKGENFEVVKDIDVDNIRRMILKGEIPNSEIKKTFFKREIFCFQKQNKILKKKVKDIKSAHIRYTYKRDKGIFSFAELKNRLSTKEYEEFWRDKLKKYELYL